MRKQKKLILLGILFIFIFSITVISNQYTGAEILTSAEAVLSNVKIEWGIKRNDNHEQPDLGAKNKELITKYNGIAMGNKEKNYIYLTFDAGYEAGYTDKILDTLKANNVQGTFFITAHYVNSAPELVKRMIDEGHIIGNQLPPSQMYRI